MVHLINNPINKLIKGRMRMGVGSGMRTHPGPRPRGPGTGTPDGSDGTPPPPRIPAPTSNFEVEVLENTMIFNTTNITKNQEPTRPAPSWAEGLARSSPLFGA